MRAPVVVNPIAGGGRWIDAGGRPRRRLSRVLSALEERGFEPAARISRFPGHAVELARDAVDDGARVVFALGGDGTAREVATALAGSESVLGLLPAGTANVLPPALGLPRSALAAARLYRGTGRVRTRPLDLGRVNSELFLMMASMGPDARALRTLSPLAKRRWGRFAVLLAGLRESLLAAPEDVTWSAEAPGRSAASADHGASPFLCVCNMALYGGRFAMAPDASPFDRRLDLVTARGRGRIALVRLGLGLALPKTRRWREMARPVTSLTVPPAGPQVLQLDGDARVLDGPLHVRVDQRSLLLLWPDPTGEPL